MSSAEVRLDGSALVVRIPMQFQRRGGRKRISASRRRSMCAWRKMNRSKKVTVWA
jgi:hypothetical protein